MAIQMGTIKLQMDTAPLKTITDTISTLATQCGSSIKDISAGLARVSEALISLGVNVFTPEGEYRNIGEVLEEAYHACDEKENDRLRPETSEITENSNENMVFDFLEQNAYDHIEPIFKDTSNLEKLKEFPF